MSGLPTRLTAVLAKANLSELCNFKSPKIPWAFSDVGGQCSSAFVDGGFVKGEGFDGPGNPSGSSSGSAVGVSAGFAPGALGTDTRGSIVGYPLTSLTPVVPGASGRAVCHLPNARSHFTDGMRSDQVRRSEVALNPASITTRWDRWP